MIRKYLIAIAATAAVLLGTMNVSDAQSMDAQLREQIARSVVQIRARNCPDGNSRVGTGFAYGQDQHVVTALHVVDGCSAIQVYWEKHGGATQQAQIVRVLNGEDLALLRAEGAPGRALQANPDKPQPNANLEVLGYYLAVPTMDNKPLRVTFGSSRLRDMLPARVRKELEAARAINLDLEIVRLDGHLLPGLSGAPILDLNGRVVAIGSGGLKSGAASVSWAVPAVNLQHLLASEERAYGNIGSSHLFSAPVLEEDGGDQTVKATEAFRCGNVQFVYTGTRTFDELTYGHDDLNSIYYMIDEAGLSEAELASFRFYTYQPLNGGAAVAVPDWIGLQYVGGERCQGRDTRNLFTIDFAGQPVRDLMEADQVSIHFGDRYAAWSGRQWQPFAPYSYIGPVTRPDGLMSNRATYLAAEAGGRASLLMRTFLIHYPQTGVSPTFTGIVGAYWNFDIQAATYCSDNPQAQGCAPYRALEVQAAQVMLAVFLSTAPLY